MPMRRYTFKLYPSAAQGAALREQARLCAVLWNALLQMREDHYRRAKMRGDKKTSLTAFDQGKDITALNRAAKTDADLAEWRGLPRGTMERVADMLDLAMKAFFKRAKGGSGAASGYPRYKSTRYAENIPLREPAKSCWKFTAHSGPACEGEPKGGRVSSHARGEEGEVLGLHSVEAASSRARAEEGGEEGPRTVGSWRLTLRGIPGTIKARGKFPVAPIGFKTADVKYHDGAWWFSICVEMPERRAAGAENLRVELDLIDEFAAVTADGRCVPDLSDPFSNGREGEIPCNVEGLQAICCGDPADAGGAQDICHDDSCCGDPADAGDAQAADSLQAARDRRYKRGSIRWRREKARIARIKARKARLTREALHRWTTAIVARARELTIIAPPIKKLTKTGRGSEQFPGAEVATVALLNRHVLAMAPASAVQMLEYKAVEAGIPCNVERREDHQIRIGGDLRAAAVANKRAKRVTKRKERKAA